MTLEDRLIVKQLDARQSFLQEGQIIRYMPFINEGLMVNHRTDEKGEDHVLQIRWGGQWLGDLMSFFTHKPSIFNITTYKPTQLLLVNHDTFDEVMATHPIYERYFRLAFQSAYVDTLNQIYNLHSASAKQRYLDLIENVPSILNDIPHYLIASYLNIKAPSLSRIRKKLGK